MVIWLIKYTDKRLVLVAKLYVPGPINCSRKGEII